MSDRYHDALLDGYHAQAAGRPLSDAPESDGSRESEAVRDNWIDGWHEARMDDEQHAAGGFEDRR